MRSDARIATLIELVDKSINGYAPVDNILKGFFRDNRFIGSKDRRFLSDMLWAILRKRYALEHKAKSKNARKMVIAFLDSDNDLDLLFTGDKYAPHPVTKEELDFDNSPPPPEMPDFLLGKLKQTFKDSWENELESFNNHARFDIRANTLKASLEVIKDETKAIKSPLSKLGLYFEQNFNITQTDAYKKGLVDIQDEGSQLICEFCDAKSGDSILDICSGAGGKSLTLAILMNNKGFITAHDIHKRRMQDLMPRADRSGITIINTKPFIDKKFDLVLVDAPCTGSGTIRRNPDKKWKITDKYLQEILPIQAEILQNSAKFSDKIIYSTCSFISDENEKQVEFFLKNNPSYSLIDEKFLSPYKNNTDSFYMAKFEKK